MNREILNLPTLLTLSRIAATPVLLSMLFAENWYWRNLAVVVFGIASITDFYDGRLARSMDRVTEFGCFMDALADKILVTSTLVALAMGRIVHVWLVVPIVIRDVIITGLRVRGMRHGRMMETSRLAKWKTSVQLVAVLLILSSISAQEVAGRYSWGEGSILLDETFLYMLFNGLVAAVVLLTVVSGFHYFLRTG